MYEFAEVDSVWGRGTHLRGDDFGIYERLLAG